MPLRPVGLAIGCLALSLLAMSRPALATEPLPPLPGLWSIDPALVSPSLLPLLDGVPLRAIEGTAPETQGTVGYHGAPILPSRPRLLVPLYVSFAALQGFDAVTTIRALDRGAVEANPMLGGLANNRGALLAVKASASAGTIYLSERLWRKNRVAAVALMAALNGAYAVIVAHNWRAVR